MANLWDRQRVEEDLRGVIAGEVDCDERTAMLYAGDGSIHQIVPLGVVRPRRIDDIIACFQYAAEHEIPIHPRGAGSGVSGESLGAGLILDMTVHFQRLLDRGAEHAIVQPGIVHGLLNHELAQIGRIFGPDPATREVATVGGVISRNGSGSRYPRYGSARDCTERLKVVLPDGSVEEFAQHTIAPLEPTSAGSWARRVAGVAARHRDVLSEFGAGVPQAGSGYALQETVTDERVDLARLLAGAEGTLGVIVEATVRTAELPACRGVALLFFRRLRDAAVTAHRVRDWPISACDLMDRRLLQLAAKERAAYGDWIPGDAEALLLVEVSGDDHRYVREQLDRLARRSARREQFATPPRIALDRTEVDLAWQLVKRVVPRLFRLSGKTRPVPFIEDVAIPPVRLAEFIDRLQEVLRRHEVIASLYGHAGHGELHVRPFLDLTDPAHRKLLPELARDFFDAVLDHEGRISVEHAWGLSRTWYLRERFPRVHAAWCELKELFDPLGVLNPGKLGDRRPPMVTEHLRPGLGPAAVDREEPAGGTASGTPADASPPGPELLPMLDWNRSDLFDAARQCNGCARCRTQMPEQRMCPWFRIRPTEEATPRAKANIMRHVLAGELASDDLRGEELKAIADLCFHCHQCRFECPANVDIPKLVGEWKAQYVANNGMRLREWWLARPERMAAWGWRFRRAANYMLSTPKGRWLLERFTGIASGRKLPLLAETPFLRQVQRSPLAETRRGAVKVAYFVDVYANWFDPELGHALVRVMQHNGIEVHVPPQQLPAGMPLVVAGAVDKARDHARRNVRILGELVRSGYRIVTTEPSAGLCLQHEYPMLLDGDREAELVAEHTVDAVTFLADRHDEGKLDLGLRPVPLTLGYHLPCHLKAQRAYQAGPRLLRLIPGLQVREVSPHCSGMAGLFGIQRKNYRQSLRMGRALIDAIRDDQLHGGTTECSTCKLQMEQGTVKPTAHPIKILAHAYGMLDDRPPVLQRQSTTWNVT